jgi:hypothetical protein
MNEAAALVSEESAAPVETEISDDSITAHEAQYGKNQPPAAAAEEVPEPPKHRAKSQRAGANDYDDIAKYTKLLRETEDGIDGFTLERLPNESERVFNLRKRVEITKLAKERRVAEAAPVAQPTRQPVPQPASQPATVTAFTEPEPKIDDFANEPDAYLALSRAWAKWDRRKETFEAEQEAAKQFNATAEQQAKAAKEAYQTELLQGYASRVAAFTKTHPDFQTVIAKADRPITPLLERALLTADNGPQLVYTLATQPQLHDEAFLLTDGKPVTEQAVASTQRWLSKLSVPVVTTGATAGAAKPISTPRPPTPVRTGPIASGDDLPGDESSLAEHEKAFGPKRRRH